MTCAAATWAASFLSGAFALAEVCSDPDAACHAHVQLAQFEDSLSLVHTSADIALEVEKEWLDHVALGEAAQFEEVTSGTCEASGFTSLGTQQECEEAAVSLHNYHNSAIQTSQSSKPSGCIWKTSNNKLYWNSDTSGTGASYPRYLLCLGQAATPTPAPTPAPTPPPTPAQYAEVTSGTCGNSGFSSLSTKQECEEAAVHLHNYHNSAIEVSQSNRPSGCVWKTGSDKLYWNSDTSGTGASHPRYLLCLGQAAAPTPAPTQPGLYFAEVTSGTCAENGYTSVSSEEECEAAAVALGKSDTDAFVRQRANNAPTGCIWKVSVNSLYWNTLSVGKGASWPRYLLCRAQGPVQAVPTPAPVPSCCDMHFNDAAFSKCDFWGDPHWTNSFGHGRFDMQGLGAFQVAASLDGEFEMQDMQCPWRSRRTPKVAVGVGINMQGTRIAVHQNFIYVNGTKVTASTASLLEDLNLAGNPMSGGVLVQSDDCCYRASIKTRAIPRYTPGFFHNVQVRVLASRAAATGVCGAGPSHDTLVGSADLLFDSALLQDVCAYCTEKPAQCTTTLPSPTPTPVPGLGDWAPEALCATAASDGDCGADALLQAQAACRALNGTEHFNGCVGDYCQSGCDSGIADSVVEERDRTPPDAIDEEDAPTIPEDNDPGITPAPVPTPATAPNCCDLRFNSPSFAKCDFWGDPHWSKSFGQGRFDMQGLGAFQVAASLDGAFEVQDMQCPWKGKLTPKVAVGIAINLQGTRIAIHQNFIYVNGTKVTASTASLLDGLKVIGDIMGRGLLFESEDCCYRASVKARAVPRHTPGFYHNVKVRVLNSRAAATGVCGGGAGYSMLVGSPDLLFDRAPLQKVCSYCTTKPPQCTTTVPSPQPTPIPAPSDMTPEVLCAQSASEGDCGVDPLAQARLACVELEGSEHFNGCIIDYCEAGCDQEIADSTVEERDRSPPDCIPDDAPSPDVPDDDDPGIAPQTPAPTTTVARDNTPSPTTTRGLPPPGTSAPTPASRDATPSPSSAGCFCPAHYSPVCGENGQTYSNSCEAGCANVLIGCTGICPCEDPSATGDPHVNNLAGEHFDVNQPADHLLLRLPLEPGRPTLLEVRAEIKADEAGNDCAMYIRMMTLRGEWFGNGTVQVRPLRRNAPGSNAAGNATTWPFSIRAFRSPAEGEWRSAVDFGKNGTAPHTLSATATVAAHLREEEFGDRPESEAFEFMVGSGAKSRASIIVFQGQRQSLNVQVKNLKALGGAPIGGLLGSEKHDPEVEEQTQECKAHKAPKAVDYLRSVTEASRLSASW